MPMRLLHGKFCSAAHKEAYFQSMDRMGLERLIAAQPTGTNTYQPCTKPVNFESLVAVVGV